MERAILCFQNCLHICVDSMSVLMSCLLTYGDIVVVSWHDLS